jgi:endo-1,4-beta-xylanase
MTRGALQIRPVTNVPRALCAALAVGLAIACSTAPRATPASPDGNAGSDGAPSLAALADRAQLRLGAAVHDTEVEAFAAAAGRDFNSMTPANALKWGSLLVDGKLGRYDFRQADALVNLALAKKVSLRGHTLVWGRYAGHGHPSDLEATVQAAPDPRRELERLMTEHIGAVLGHFRGRITQWDAVNEPLDLFEAKWDDNVFYRTLGPEFVGQAFHIAHAADPSLELVLNEQLSRYDDEHAEKLFGIIQHLHDTGAPIHGVGLQSHLLSTVPSIASLKLFMRRIADLGLFIEITELDARIGLFSDAPDPAAAQGRFFREIAAACLEEPSCRGITVWGISDRHSWLDTFPPFDASRPNAPLLFDHDMQRKPAYQGFADALAQGRAGRSTAAP